MKKILYLLLSFTFLATFPTRAGQLNIPLNAAAPRGAATINELANVVFAAVQSNSFDQLPLYVPTDADLSNLKKRSSEDLQVMLDELTAATVTASLKESFETVVREGVEKMLNLNELTLSDVRTGKPDAKNKMLVPVTATLTTRANQPLPLRFEAIKINGRYFLFQQMQWQAVN